MMSDHGQCAGGAGGWRNRRPSVPGRGLERCARAPRPARAPRHRRARHPLWQGLSGPNHPRDSERDGARKESGGARPHGGHPGLRHVARLASARASTARRRGGVRRLSHHPAGARRHLAPHPHRHPRRQRRDRPRQPFPGPARDRHRHQLSRRARPHPPLAAKATHTGNPIRPAVLAAAAMPYAAARPDGRLCLLVVGGSQGARVLADVVPDAIARLDENLRQKLAIVQQARDEDLSRVTAAYQKIGVPAEVQTFFSDLPARLAAAQLVVSRSGASTVAELAAVGRPAILVPLPGALDQDQLANARVLEQAGGALPLTQNLFTPDRLAAEIASLVKAPEKLAALAAAARTAGAADAADRLADLVMRVARFG